MRLAVRDFGTALAPSTSNVASATDASKFDASVAGATFSFWIKFTQKGQGNTVALFVSPEASGDALRLNIEDTNKLFMWNVATDGTGNLGAKTSKAMPIGVWLHVVCVYDGNAGNTIYVNGVQAATGNSGKVVRPTHSFKIYPSSNGGEYMDDVRCWMRPLTAQEVADLYYSSINSSVPTIWWEFNEGSGTVALDSSGNGNDGTITGATYTSDVPMKARTAVPTSGDPRLMRRAVGGNMVLNGDFEYAPPFTAATTTSTRWIDGTAPGSTTNSTFGWGTYFEFSGSANYDSTVRANGSYSIKLSAVGSPPSSNHRVDANTDASPALAPAFGTPVVAGTAYILTYKMKTFAVTNSNGNGARLRVATSAADGGSIVYTDGPYITGTTDFTSYTVSFTPTTGQVFLKIQCEIRGEQGTAWFDDIVLKPTLPVTRALAGNRTLA